MSVICTAPTSNYDLVGRPLAGGDFQSMADGNIPLPPALVQRIDRLHRP